MRTVSQQVRCENYTAARSGLLLGMEFGVLSSISPLVAIAFAFVHISDLKLCFEIKETMSVEAVVNQIRRMSNITKHVDESMFRGTDLS